MEQQWPSPSSENWYYCFSPSLPPALSPLLSTHCVHSSQSVFPISPSLPLHPSPLNTHLPRLEHTKLWSDARPPPSSLPCSVWPRCSPSLTLLSPLFDYIQPPPGEGYHVIKSIVLLDTRALTQVPLQPGFEKEKEEKDREAVIGGEMVRNMTDEREGEGKWQFYISERGINPLSWSHAHVCKRCCAF